MTSMGFDALNPDGTGVFIWASRIKAVTNVGARETVVLARWPAKLSPISTEIALADGFADATHRISGPAWPGRILQSGDVLTRIAGRRSGRNYVRAGKAWSVVGRQLSEDDGDYGFQVLYVREPV